MKMSSILYSIFSFSSKRVNFLYASPMFSITAFYDTFSNATPYYIHIAQMGPLKFDTYRISPALWWAWVKKEEARIAALPLPDINQGTILEKLAFITGIIVIGVITYYTLIPLAEYLRSYFNYLMLPPPLPLLYDSHDVNYSLGNYSLDIFIDRFLDSKNEIICLHKIVKLIPHLCEDHIITVIKNVIIPIRVTTCEGQIFWVKGFQTVTTRISEFSVKSIPECIHRVYTETITHVAAQQIELISTASQLEVINTMV